ncbi:hypothetical protein SD70_01900 [Gordoniibacillus kamchatkensis]|uniref:Secreted protein n=1 Tax=Gordoniibacillus kamchatkensis TaxID=1590651 RepID=A0ABR5APK0_9BACL|nr:hypothetical protein SD70_01900 [Paenibacillus sp. VKM B-2647]
MRLRLRLTADCAAVAVLAVALLAEAALRRVSPLRGPRGGTDLRLACVARRTVLQDRTCIWRKATALLVRRLYVRP